MSANDMKEIHSFEEVPEFENEEEEAEFWATHSLGDGLLDKMERRNKLLEGRQYSGKVNLRMPKSLHRDLVHDAEQEGVSLNQLIVATLARSMGEKRRWIS